MNRNLMEQIVRHIFSNLGILSASFFDQEKSKSLISDEFKLLDKKLTFYDNDLAIHRSVFGCAITIADKEFKILAGDCSIDNEIPEYCVIVQLTGMPVYGMYLVCDPNYDTEPLIGVTLNNKDWMPCTTFLQATLLAAMEQLREVGLSWSKCTKYQDHFNTLQSMIKFHHNYYEVQDEG